MGLDNEVIAALGGLFIGMIVGIISATGLFEFVILGFTVNTFWRWLGKCRGLG